MRDEDTYCRCPRGTPDCSGGSPQSWWCSQCLSWWGGHWRCRTAASSARPPSVSACHTGNRKQWSLKTEYMKCVMSIRMLLFVQNVFLRKFVVCIVKKKGLIEVSIWLDFNDFFMIMVVYLPKHGVKVCSVELIRHPRSREFGTKQGDEFFKGDLAVTWGKRNAALVSLCSSCVGL